MKRFKRRNNRSLIRRNSTLILFLGLLLLSQIIVALFTSPLFNLQQILVYGNVNLPEEAIIQASGLTLGRNLLRINPREIGARLRSLPEIASARVYRVLPRTIVLKVKERVPYALLSVGGHFYLLDSEGVPFQEEKEPLKSPLELPRLAFQNPLKVRLGEALRDPEFEYGWAAFKQMMALGVRPLECSVDPLLNLCLNIRDSKVRMGQPVDLPRKVELFKGLVQADPGILAKAEYIDLSAPEAPAWKPRSVGTSKELISSASQVQ